jgi:molecular chaperone GrpE
VSSQQPPEIECEAVEAALAGSDDDGTPEIAVGESLDFMAALQKLEEEVAAAREQELRTLAELDNVRKRASRQLEEERKYAAVSLVRDLLGVLDNLERAMDAADKNGNSAGLLEGVKLVAQQFHRVLEQHHCQRIEAKGQVFDPGRHQAISQMPSAEYPAGTVAEVAQVGYQMHDRIVRPSMVLVSTGPASLPATGAGVDAAE